LLRVPGDSPGSLACALSPRVAAIIAQGTITASSTVSPVVLATSVWPEISAPGACPVCSVVTPKPRTHSIRRSRAL
jgi:hypothetical protein